MGKFSQKWVKKQRIGYISEAISPTDFILGTKVQHIKAHSMTLVPMAMTEGQSRRSMSNLKKKGKKLNNYTYLGCYITYRLYT